MNNLSFENAKSKAQNLTSTDNQTVDNERFNCYPMVMVSMVTITMSMNSKGL